MKLRIGFVALVLALAPATSTLAQKGAITQLAGTDACVSEDGTGGSCADGVALSETRSVGASPDGKHVYAVSSDSNSVSVFTRAKRTGALTQLAGTDGCVSEDGTGGMCADGVALDGAWGVDVSPDGKNVYVAATGSSAVAVFARDKNTGVLTQLPGTAGCVSEDGTGGMCTDGRALGTATRLAVSRDGKHVYVVSASSHAVAVFSRDKQTGALTQLPGTAGCISENGTGGLCTDGVALMGAQGVAQSADGRNVYVASATSDAVAAFSRDGNTGALSQLGGTAGCVSEDGTGGMCADGVALELPLGVAVSRNGRHVYAASSSSNAVAIFARNRKTGALTQLAGTDGCVSDDGTGGLCTDGVALSSPTVVSLSPDGKTLYAAAFTSNAIAVFSRHNRNGRLTQLPGAAGCVSEDGTGGMCADGVALIGSNDVCVPRRGKQLYGASTGSAAVTVFTRQK